MKRNVVLSIILIPTLIVAIGVGAMFFTNKQQQNQQLNEQKLPDLPKPELSEGQRGALKIDKNINETTIDNYLGRDDSVYLDMRMLVDEANYEAISGDSKLSGFVKGFEAIPFPLLVNVTGLPEEVGETYKGETLFTKTESGEYRANFEESMAFMEYHFPKDKNIFLMCGGGGYAGSAKDMLVALGWDEEKIYNTGAYWGYSGENNVEVKRDRNGEDVYDFWKVTYHDIKFDDLHKVD